MKIKEIAKEFEAFILKGNVVDLAVAVVIGAAFKSVVDAIVSSIINPLLAIVHLMKADGGLNFYAVLTSAISFVAIAAVVFFFVVKPMNYLIAMSMKKAQTTPAEAPPLPQDVQLLIEIRDLLKAQAKPAEPPKGENQPV
ncbi:MAG TPA: MscL family protein [Chthoniobacter sp.]|jgi:large conductance mechanosensitive channel